MPYDVRAKHGSLIDLLSVLYKEWFGARVSFFKAKSHQRWERHESKPAEKKGIDAWEEMQKRSAYDVLVEHTQEHRDNEAWAEANEDRKRWDELGKKLFIAVTYVVKTMSPWHASRIRTASSIWRSDWSIIQLTLGLSYHTFSRIEREEKGEDRFTDYGKALGIVGSFNYKELKTMTYAEYTKERETRAIKLLEMKISMQEV